MDAGPTSGINWAGCYATGLEHPQPHRCDVSGLAHPAASDLVSPSVDFWGLPRPWSICQGGCGYQKRSSAFKDFFSIPAESYGKFLRKTMARLTTSTVWPLFSGWRCYNFSGTMVLIVMIYIIVRWHKLWNSEKEALCLHSDSEAGPEKQVSDNITKEQIC